MLNRFGEPVEIVMGRGDPFVLIDPELGELLEAELRRQGFKATLDRSAPALIDSLDPNDPGEWALALAAGEDADAVQDLIDSLEIDANGVLRVVSV